MLKAMHHQKNVVRLADFQKDTRYPACAQVEAYWETARNGRDMPYRHQIDPRGISDALSATFVAETIAPGVARLRIAGAALTDVLGMEVRGMPLTSFFTPKARLIVAEVIEQVLRAPSVATLHLTAETSMGRPVLEARLMLMPLKTDLEQPNRLLGVLETKGDIGRTPRRFDIAYTRERKISVNVNVAVMDEHPISKRPKSATPQRADLALSVGLSHHLRLVKTTD